MSLFDFRKDNHLSLTIYFITPLFPTDFSASSVIVWLVSALHKCKYIPFQSVNILFQIFSYKFISEIAYNFLYSNCFCLFCAIMAIDLDMTLDHRHKDQTLELAKPSAKEPCSLKLQNFYMRAVKFSFAWGLFGESFLFLKV